MRFNVAVCDDVRVQDWLQRQAVLRRHDSSSGGGASYIFLSQFTATTPLRDVARKAFVLHLMIQPVRRVRNWSNFNVRLWREADIGPTGVE
jgi:hypothetical protein